jgi:UDP:flavonoid glycosyltransferase YjiC (YdhE family)
VTVATLRHYAPRVAAAGLAFHPIGPDFDPSDPAELKRAMHKRRGPEYVLREMTLGHLRTAFDDLRPAAAATDLSVTHPLALGAQLLARAAGRPWASSVLSPLSLFSTTDPAIFSGVPFEQGLARLGPRGQRIVLRLADFVLSRWLAPYRAIEAELGLAPGPNPILHGQHSPHLVLALFSPHFGPRQDDWPANTVATGFPFLADPQPLAPEIERFLAAGPPPVVFTLGSAAVGAAGAFYERSIAAVERLGRRAVLLIGTDPANLPRRALPEDQLAVTYAPHAALFARAAAVVHQGGVGTSAEALRSGRPMLVVPHCHDQPDNAHRLERLGVARVVPAERYTVRRATRALASLLQDAEARDRARVLGQQIAAESGVATACDALERLL